MDDFPFFPDEWVLRNHSDSFVKLDKEISKLCEKLNLFSYCWIETVWNIIFFNYYSSEEHILNRDYDLCCLGDIFSQKKNIYESSVENEVQDDFVDRLDKEYPVVLRISPSASIKEIVDYLSKNKKHLVRIQNSYNKKRIPNVREKDKNIQLINDFIYEQRSLPRKQIMQMLYERFGTKLNVDYGNIGKVISLETKKRGKKL
jgi:hypothetical protein